MTDFKDTRLWATTLAEQASLEEESARESRERLRSAFLSFRGRAETLAGEVARTLPEFTVHDISHLDALWEMTDVVAGSNYSLTPTEAFVLGGAFLVHDLGMGLAAYPKGVQELRNEEGWNDALASAWKRELGRLPDVEEFQNAPDKVEKLATAEVLRLLHAQRAEKLAFTSWQAHGGETYHLIENPELRRELGPIIGRIAYSHWWSVSDLREEFPTTFGAPYGYPRDWTIDALKLACLLRVADISHIDARRAPGYLRAVRQPQGTAATHWVFQERLHQPQLSDGRLLYTSAYGFTVEEAPAWWLCFDTLSMVDHELRQVDALLADVDRPRLAARSVVGVEDPERLVPLVRTQGWTPIDAKIRVGNVAELVKRLGGEELYGREPTVPLRELIQNACDAVRARRVFEDRASNWGEVQVRLGKDDEGYWVEVEDTGIGMSADTLSRVLLDFGASYWGSSLMQQELPGLLASSFLPAGKYGIGFFSVFMWGQRVHIITRRPDKAQRETLVLEFKTGLESRPILREAKEKELLREGGTLIRVWLETNPYEEGQMLHRQHPMETWSMADLCAWLCPSIDVNLVVEENKSQKLAVSAEDWKTLEGEDLIQRIAGSSADATDIEDGLTWLKTGRNLRFLKSAEGTVVGRACIRPPRSSMLSYLHIGAPDTGTVTVGGLRSTNLGGVAGILVGRPERAARDVAIPVVGVEELAGWATEQAGLLEQLSLEPELQVDLAAIVRALGGDTKDLFITKSAAGYESRKSIIGWSDPPDEVLLLDPIYILHRYEELRLNSNVLVVQSYMPGIWDGTPRVDVDWPPLKRRDAEDAWVLEEVTLQGLVIEALADVWGASKADILTVSSKQGDEVRTRREVGTQYGRTVEEGVLIMRNPQVSLDLLRLKSSP